MKALINSIGLMEGVLFVALIYTASAQTLKPLEETLNEVENRLARLEAVLKKLSGESEPEGAASRLEGLDSVQQNSYGRLADEFIAFQQEVAEIPVEANVSQLEASAGSLETRLTDLANDLEAGKSENTSDARIEIVRELAGDLRQLVRELREAIPAEERQRPNALEAVVKWVPIEITGFGDITRATRLGKKAGANYLGQVEFDLETHFEEKIGIVAGIAYNGETFELVEFVVDFHIFGSKGSHLRPVTGIDHSGIRVGQFDVPFGIDWQVYPSIDRRMVNGPMAVEKLHDYWNDIGIQFYTVNRWFNAVVFGTNGFGYGDREMKMALGGRFGFIPSDYLEVGGSFVGFLDEQNHMDMVLSGLDLQLAVRALSVEGEYIRKTVGLAGKEGSFTGSGYYAQVIYDFSRFYLMGRYGTFSPWKTGEADLSRISAGGGVKLLHSCEIRCEYQRNTKKEDVFFTQLVVGF